MHLQFAYYESSMVVEYVVERWGAAAVGKVLEELGNDVAINVALAKHTEPIEKLDESFAAWFKTKAEGLATGVDWEKPEIALDAGSDAMRAWVDSKPGSFWGWLGLGRALVAEKMHKEAVPALEKAAALYPTYGEAGGPWILLAAAHRELRDAKAERANLEKHVALDAEAVEARVRLIELAAGEKDWKAVREVASQLLGINPLIPAPHRSLAQAAEALGERALAIEAQRTLLLLDPLDRADHHYKLAKLLVEENQLAAARQEVVKALEEAPRFRDAHRLLLEIVEKSAAVTGPPAAASEPSPASSSASPSAPPSASPTTSPPASTTPEDPQP
jgi:tetratricopeptide (TPR) repeat protein